MTKEEILAKRILKFPEAPNMTDEAIKRNVGNAMQEYADLRCKPLIKALYSAKETLGLAVLLDKSDTMQNEINEIEKVLQDYNKK